MDQSILQYVVEKNGYKSLDIRLFLKAHGPLLYEHNIYTNLIMLVALFDQYESNNIHLVYIPQASLYKPARFHYCPDSQLSKEKQYAQYLSKEKTRETNTLERIQQDNIDTLTQYRIIKDAYLIQKRNAHTNFKEELYALNEELYPNGHGCISQYYLQLTRDLDILARLNEQGIYERVDALNDGLLGLLDAVETYPIASGVDFVKYAERYMRDRITHGALEASNPELPGGKLSPYYYQIMKLHDKYMLEGYEEDVILRMIYKDINTQKEIITTPMIEQALAYRYRYEKPRSQEIEELNPFMSMETFRKTHLYDHLRPYFRFNLHKQFVRIFERLDHQKKELVIFLYDLNDTRKDRIEELTKDTLSVKAYQKAIDQADHEYSMTLRKDMFASTYHIRDINELEEEAYDDILEIGGQRLVETYDEFINNYIKVTLID